MSQHVITFPSRYTNFTELVDLVLMNDYLVVADGKTSGEALYPVVYPRLAWAYFGFQVHRSSAITVALFAPNGYSTVAGDPPQVSVQRPGYFYFDGDRWLPTEDNLPTFMTPSQLRAGMPYWMGALQFRVKLTPGAALQELIFGYQVHIDIIDYLLRFALPQFLAQPCLIPRMTYVATSGYVPLPLDFEVGKLTDVRIQPMGCLPIPARATDKGIQAEGVALPPQPVQLLFSITPFIEFAKGDYELQEVPCVILREMPVRQQHKLFRAEPVAIADGQSALDNARVSFDFSVEAFVIADSDADASAIANTLMNWIDAQGRIYLPPIDSTVGVFVEPGGGKEGSAVEAEGGMGASAPKNTRGNLPTVKFRMTFKNLAT